MSELHKVLKAGGLRKVAIGTYMFSAICVLLWHKCLDAATFAEIAKVVILAVFAGNAAEHFAPKVATPEA